MEQQKLTKKEFEELHKNLNEYIKVETDFTIRGYGGQLLTIIMAIKMFSRLEPLPAFIARDFRNLVEKFKQEFMIGFPGIHLINFEEPAQYFALLTQSNNDVVLDALVEEFENIWALMEQKLNEDN